MVKILLSELFAYLLFLVFVYIEEPLLVVVFLVAVIGCSFLCRKRFAGWLAGIEQSFADQIGLAGLIAFLIALTVPFALLGDSYWLQVLNFMMLNAIMALGLNFMTGRAGLICLGFAAFMAIGAYTVGILTLKVGVSFWLALPLAGLFSSILGVILGLPALRVKGHYLALVTIAFGLIVQEILLNWESVTGGTNGLINIPSPSLLGFDLGTSVDFGFMNMTYQVNFYYLCLVLLSLASVVLFRLSNSLFGLALNAMREDQLAAQCYGLNLTKYKLLAFAIGAFFGGIAGGVYAAMINFIAPENFGYSLSIIVISMIILGGLDSIPGALAGAFLLTVFPEKFRAFEDYRVLFYGLVIVLCLLFMREGILPFKHHILKPKPTEGGHE